MARVKLDIPSKIIASISVPVRITDINYGNHVGNDSFISIIHEARVQWLQQHNFTEINVAGTSLIMGGLAVEFKSESFYGDILTVNISCGEITRVGFELYYQLFTERNNTRTMIANAKTDMVCFDYAAKKVIAVPEILSALLRNNIAS